jgi:hypothetical protein
MVIEYLVYLLQKGDSNTQNILWGWVTDRNLAEIREKVPQ